MENNKAYFSHLYQIASHLNREFSLNAALRISLQKTVELLDLETGWIWLVQADIKSVYLAASYNLPPALSDRPERLSGWCYCIEKYLSNDMETASNISEIACTRLTNIKTGTRNLKFHATIPISAKDGHKIGLLNLLSKETQQLNQEQLALLNTISELIAIVIQRTRTQESYANKHSENELAIFDILDRVFNTRLKTLSDNLLAAYRSIDQKDVKNTLENIKIAINQAEELQHQLALILSNSIQQQTQKKDTKTFHYPDSPLTKREFEVLILVKKGYINRQIAEQLFIAERTVKFHISSILSKLYANTRTEAVNIAVQRGLLGA